MGDRVRLGVIGASSRPHGWAARAHLPALKENPDIELVAVCTTRLETAEESRRLFGAERAYDDLQAMLAEPDIEAVSVVVRVPAHFAVAKAALEAGKAVYTEWPLGRTTHEAVELTDIARNQGVITAVGLQTRVQPAYRYVRDLIADGYIGEVLSCHAMTITSGALAKRADFLWSGQASGGSNTLTVTNGHTLDAVTFLLGGISTISAQLTTQVRQWGSLDGDEVVEVDAPDTVIVAGSLESGATYSSYSSMVPYAGQGFRIEIYGGAGTVLVSGEYHPQNSDVTIRAARGGNDLAALEVPHSYLRVARTTAAPQPYGVAAMYHEFARSIRAGDGEQPDFGVAVELHHLLDDIRRAADEGRCITR